MGRTRVLHPNLCHIQRTNLKIQATARNVSLGNSLYVLSDLKMNADFQYKPGNVHSLN